MSTSMSSILPVRGRRDSVVAGSGSRSRSDRSTPAMASKFERSIPAISPLHETPTSARAVRPVIRRQLTRSRRGARPSYPTGSESGGVPRTPHHITRPVIAQSLEIDVSTCSSAGVRGLERAESHRAHSRNKLYNDILNSTNGRTRGRRGELVGQPKLRWTYHGLGWPKQ